MPSLVQQTPNRDIPAAPRASVLRGTHCAKRLSRSRPAGILGKSPPHARTTPCPFPSARSRQAIGGEVTGIDITKPLKPEEVAAIEAGMDKYAVLVFPGQQLTDEQQMAFTVNFGPIEDARGGNVTKPQDKRLVTGMNDVSNLGKDGKPLARDSRQRLFNIGNMLWHSDSSFRPIPAKYSLLSARVVNKKGGNTEFAHMGAAYEALDDDTKREIEDLVCEHSLMYSRGSLGFLDYTDEEKAMFKPVRQRLVRTHPVTGRKSLYLSSHAGAILGMPMPEARMLLNDLKEHATQPRFVYVHKWTLYDLVIWDNRQTMHRVRRYDDSQPRDMRRTTVAGSAPTVAQAADRLRRTLGSAVPLNLVMAVLVTAIQSHSQVAPSRQLDWMPATSAGMT
jgi:alpha-ketoglutarate-dependent 2,4-dichlorophenoxyacetate dioxygenase